MNKRCIILLLISLGSITYVNAQIETVELDEVVIEALPFEKFSSGSKIVKSDSLQLVSIRQGTLSDYLQRNSTVYVKEQGNKMLASVSFRGTGASHTGVFWHGINLNSLTLGTSDFNAYPLFLFDGITVHYGGASSLHGSDAIGGSIHLRSISKWTNGSHIGFQQDIGSFGNVFTGVKVEIGNGNWESRTKIFNRILDNNFTYKITDRLGASHEIEQQNAEVHNMGILQEFNKKMSSSGNLSLKAWLGNNQHKIQPMTITSPDQEQGGDEIEDKYLRLLGEYQHFFKKGILIANMGVVWDHQLYNQSDLIEIKRFFTGLSYELDVSNKTTLKAGGNGQYIVPDVWSYDGGISEWRGDAFLSLNHEIVDGWQANLNVRKTFVPFTGSPVAPSISTSYLIKKSNMELTFRGQVERSYRIPTFNDRFWGDQGNLELDSEHGYSIEIGHNLLIKQHDYSFELDIATYYMTVDDWIAWKPAGNLWKPYNLKQVEGSGIELDGKYRQKIHNIFIEVGGMYSYNSSLLREGISENDPAIGYQLPYTPKHRAAFYTNILFHKYRLSIYTDYTGKRNGIDVINEEIDAFLVTDISLSNNFYLCKHMFSVEGQVSNVFNVSYQNVNRYAMPGRNYLLSINFFIDN